MPTFFDEMYADGKSTVREHYREFEACLSEQSADTIARKRAEADLIFRRVGITFPVYGDDAGTERLVPSDVLSPLLPFSFSLFFPPPSPYPFSLRSCSFMSLLSWLITT